MAIGDNTLFLPPDFDKYIIPDSSSEIAPPKLAASIPDDRWRLLTLDDALDSKDQRPNWVIKDLLLRESGAIVSAHPHAMKSLSWLAACMQAPATGKVWDHFEAPEVRNTLFIETEDPAWLVNARVVGLSKGLKLGEKPNSLPGFHYACTGPFDLLNSKGNVARLLDQCEPDFVVLSTLQSLLGGLDWSRQPDMQPIMAYIVELSRRCPVVLITHSPKDKRQKGAAGTITQAANFATLLHYEKSGSDVTVSIDSKASGETKDFAIRLETDGALSEPGSVRTVCYVGEARVSKADRIREVLEAEPHLAPSDVAHKVGCSSKYVKDITKKIHEEAQKKAKQK